MENWIQLFRAYKSVHTVDLSSLNTNFISRKLEAVQIKKKMMEINARWRRITNKLLETYYEEINQKWKRLI
jgi:hypothetical protein